MKEIMIGPHNGNIISTSMISLEDAIRQAYFKFIISIIYRQEEPYPRWIQLIVTDSNNNVEVRDIPINSNDHGSILPAWRDRNISEFMSEITQMYPRSEFYLIEYMEDLCKLLKARCPSRWWED